MLKKLIHLTIRKNNTKFKMNAVGVIAEYNPFHNGHLHHLKEAKKFAGENAVVVVMSGNFVQRGEPAILNKWDRAKIALNQGADLVVEIPTLFCLGSANQYANASIKLLESIGCVDKFIFGSETGDIDLIKSISNDLRNSKNQVDAYIKELTKEGYSYPRARAAAYNKLFPESQISDLLNNSNDSLAIEYVMSASNMEAYAIKRIENVSASKVRESYWSSKDVSDMVPDFTNQALNDCKTTCCGEWFQTLQYAVIRMSADEIDDCPSGGEGLGNRVKSFIDKAKCWDEFVQLVKSKRYTYTRLSRLCMQIILGISRKEYQIESPKYLRILGLNAKGRELISKIEDEELNALPFITNISKQKNALDKECLKLLELDIHSSDVYNLISERDVSKMSDYRIPPIIIE